MKRICLIGLGQQTQSELIPALKLFGDEVQVIAVCDQDLTRAQLFQAEFPQAQIFSDYHDFFAAKLTCDGVVVAVPHVYYQEICQLALTKNIPVFKEKPFSMDLKQGERFASWMEKTHIPIFTVTKREFYPAYQRGQELLSEIGQPYQYLAKHFIPHGNIYEGWRSRPDLAGGGVLLDMGYHLLDVLVRYFGEPEDISMWGSHTGKPGYEYQVEDAASLLLRHANGIHGCFLIACLTGPKQESVEIHGTNGVLLVQKDRVQVLNQDGTVRLEENFAADGVQSTWQAMKQFFVGSWEAWQENLHHNLQLMRIIEKAYKHGGNV